MDVPGGAIIFASVNGIHLEQPSETQKKHVQKADREALVPREDEWTTAALREKDSDDGGDGIRRPPKSIFRRNRVKGPNPLSRLPKKKKAQGAIVAGGAPLVAENGTQEKKRRQRRRREGDGGGSAATID